MADRKDVVFLNNQISKAIHPLIEYEGIDFDKGMKGKWYALRTLVHGSLDYFHLVSFPLSGMNQHNHPMFLDGKHDDIDIGFINADLSYDGKPIRIFDNFDPEWCLCPNGEREYPPWNGWPCIDNTKYDFPTYMGYRIPVFLNGMMFKVEAESQEVNYQQTFDIVYQRAIKESSRLDLNDIRVYRSLKSVPSQEITEVPRKINGSTITIKIGNYFTHDIPHHSHSWFLLFWNSPDLFIDIDHPNETFNTNDVTSFLNITTYSARNLFDNNRYDLINFANKGSKYLKHTNSTKYYLTDGRSTNYNKKNPVFYSLPLLEGGLSDDDVDEDSWMYFDFIDSYGYNLSLPKNERPSDDSSVFGVILSCSASAGSGTNINAIKGPMVPAEFHPKQWSDFQWYPPVDDGVILAKIIIRQKRIASGNVDEYTYKYSPPYYIEYIEVSPSYGDELIKNTSFLDIFINLFYKDDLFPDFFNIKDALITPLLKVSPPTSTYIAGAIESSSFTVDDRMEKLLNSYWKMPHLHPCDSSEYEFKGENFHQYKLERIHEQPPPLEFNENVRKIMWEVLNRRMFSVLSSFCIDSKHDDFGFNVYKDKYIYGSSPIEIFFSSSNTCELYSIPPVLQNDYSIQFHLRDIDQNYITKTLHIGASKYWITDKEADKMLSEKLSRDAYLWPSKLNSKHEWVLHGRSDYIPDAKVGEFHTVLMKQFKPRNPSLPLYDEFIKNLRKQYYDDLNSGDNFRIKRAEENILDAVTDQEYLYGGFDNPDYRTLGDRVVSLDELAIGVTLYEKTGITHWESPMGFYGNPDFYEDDGGMIDRYGFKVNEEWFYQSFDFNDVADNRRNYFNNHPDHTDVLQCQLNDMGDNVDFIINDKNKMLSTSFIADFAEVDNEVVGLKLKLKMVGIPVVNLIASINNVDNNKPSSIIQTSELVPYTKMGNEFQWVKFEFLKPFKLTKDKRYAICLTASSFSENTILDESNYIQWAYSDSDEHVYGATNISTVLSKNANEGDIELYVSAMDNFSDDNFYINIGCDIIKVEEKYEKNIDGTIFNIFKLDTPINKNYPLKEIIYEIEKVALNEEQRWVLQLNNNTIKWVDVESNLRNSAAYIMNKKNVDISMVEKVPTEEWCGNDLISEEDEMDGFFIVEEDDVYDVKETNFYGVLEGINPVACFNTPGVYGFPPMNTWRSGLINRIDGYFAWNSKRFKTPRRIALLPLAIIQGGNIAYIPIKNDVYLTVIAKKWNNEKVMIQKKIPSGTNTPLLLDEESKFIGIDMVYIGANSFDENKLSETDSFSIISK